MPTPRQRERSVPTQRGASLNTSTPRTAWLDEMVSVTVALVVGIETVDMCVVWGWKVALAMRLVVVSAVVATVSIWVLVVGRDTARDDVGSLSRDDESGGETRSDDDNNDDNDDDDDDGMSLALEDTAVALVSVWDPEEEAAAVSVLTRGSETEIFADESHDASRLICDAMETAEIESLICDEMDAALDGGCVVLVADDPESEFELVLELELEIVAAEAIPEVESATELVDTVTRTVVLMKMEIVLVWCTVVVYNPVYTLLVFCSVVVAMVEVAEVVSCAVSVTVETVVYVEVEDKFEPVSAFAELVLAIERTLSVVVEVAGAVLSLLVRIVRVWAVGKSDETMLGMLDETSTTAELLVTEVSAVRLLIDESSSDVDAS